LSVPDELRNVVFKFADTLIKFVFIAFEALPTEAFKLLDILISALFCEPDELRSAVFKLAETLARAFAYVEENEP
jgi:hypothetical protein